MREIIESLQKRIERIEQALIQRDPEFFTQAFCEHDFKVVNFARDFKGESTSGLIPCVPFQRCRKCGYIKKNENLYSEENGERKNDR